MTDVSAKRGLKRKSQQDVPPSQPLSESPKVLMLSPSVLLLEIPADANTSLPVWDAVRSEQVDVSWTVDPYRISVHFTPAPSQQAATRSQSTSSVSQVPEPSSSIPQPHMIIQSIGDTSLLMLAMSQDGRKPPPPPPPRVSGGPRMMAQTPTAASSRTVSLPIIIAQPQVPSQPRTALRPVTQAPTSTSTRPRNTSRPRQYHTRSNGNVKICDSFLLSVCHAGRRCRMHHTPYPFHWQIRRAANRKWVDIAPRSQVLLERLYCNVYRTGVNLKDGDVLYHVNFNTMELQVPSTYDRVRRLSTADDPRKNPHFATIWNVYWWSGIHWKAYHEDLQKLLRLKLWKTTECSYRVGKRECVVDFKTMTETDMYTQDTVAIRCRPQYRSPDSMEPHLRTGVQIRPTQPPAPSFSIDPLQEFISWYPPVWLTPSEDDVSLVDVPACTQVYRGVCELFHETMCETNVDVVSIHQVQNLLHWDKYQRYKAYMQKHHGQAPEPLERHLFHGTTMHAAEDICHTNFDPRLAGINGTAYGYGSYFAATAHIANRHSVQNADGVSYMFLAKVLVGKACLGCSQYRRPPPLDGDAQQYRRYDSCVNSACDPTIFVVFQSCQCYPYYLIRYKFLPDEVDI